MKRIIKVFEVAIIIAGLIAGLFYYISTKYEDEIYLYYRDNIKKEKENIKLNKNEFYKDKDYILAQNTNDFIVKDKKQLLNIFYTIINSGSKSFTFYCDNNYKSCTTDATLLIEDKETLSHINNFVHPYNSFKSISMSYDDYGEINIKISHLYTQNDILELNKKIDEIISKEIKSNMTNKQKIEIIHNYIINNGRYATDEIRNANKNKSYSKANDILIDGYGLCGSYADAMAIFLNKLNINNYKIASESHIWNLVNIDNKWLHLDLTWDDPITQNKKDKLETIFMLIDSKKLKDLKTGKHSYNINIYKEAK